ncbi:MAG: DUF433 domain-containing protein [Acidobacteria bacterium]|nr:DUF433 domain-containing protein [Acidobacteriota bacterium]
MLLEDYFDFLSQNEIRLKGHRIGIEDVLYEHIYNEMTPAELARRFPTLSEEQIYATITYYLHKREQMDAYLSAWLELGRRKREEQTRNPTPAMRKLRRIKDELKAAEQKDAELRST